MVLCLIRLNRYIVPLYDIVVQLLSSKRVREFYGCLHLSVRCESAMRVLQNCETCAFQLRCFPTYTLYTIKRNFLVICTTCQTTNFYFGKG